MRRSMLLVTALIFFLTTNGISASTPLNHNASALHSVSDETSGEVKLALIGIIYDEATLKPMGNVTVELVDVAAKTSVTILSQKDGHFYFQLRSDKYYHINLRSATGALLVNQELSTTNKQQPEILQMLLTVPGTAALNMASN